MTRVPTHKDGWTYTRIEARVVGRDGSSYRAVCSVHGPVGPWTSPRSKANDHRLRHIGEHGETPGPRVGDRVYMDPDQAVYRFGRYVGFIGRVLDVSPNGRVVTVEWPNRAQDYIAPERLEIIPVRNGSGRELCLDRDNRSV